MCMSTMGCYVLCVWGGGTLFELSFVADVLHTWFCRVRVTCQDACTCTTISLTHMHYLGFAGTSVPSSVILSCKLSID